MLAHLKIFIFPGKTFPGKLSPRPQLIEPRRMELTPDSTNEWKNIGSRRTKFEDLGLPVPPAVKMFPRHTTAIFVKEAATNDSINNI